MGSEHSVLVLGAYGFVGAEVVKGLIDTTSVSVIAAGRNAEKLHRVHPETHNRLSLAVMDAFDENRLRGLCSAVDLVINCVGPYNLGGAEIAHTVIESGTNYIDFANEQNHFRQVAAFDLAASQKGVFLMTAAGLVPGFSTLLMLMADKEIGGATSLETYYAERRRVDPEAGLASILSGALETGYESHWIRNGKKERYRMGSAHGYADMPEPIGRTYVLAVPGADIEIISSLLPVQNMQNWFGMEKPPLGFFPLTRILKPHKNPGVYSIMKKMITHLVMKEHDRAIKKGIGPDMVLSVKANNNSQSVEYQMWSPDGGKGTAYFPVAVSKMWAEGRFPFKGFVTPTIFSDPKSVFNEMDDMGFKYKLTKMTDDKFSKRIF